METGDWITADVPLDQYNAARMYDYMLGGYHNFEVDRQVAQRILMLSPESPVQAQANRAFLRRAVTWLAQQGIDQFLDIGSGIPTAGNVHEVAQKVNPAARVVYVDIDPVAVIHSKAILHGNTHVLAIQGDLAAPEAIIHHPECERFLDLSRPVGLLLFAVLNFIYDNEQVYGLVSTLRQALASGSYLAITHITDEDAPPEIVERLRRLAAGSKSPTRIRSRAEIAPFFTGLDMVEPGLVHIPLWRPEGPDDLFLDRPSGSMILGGIGRKP